MFSETHYVPILKWKQGEQKALEALPLQIKERLTPLLEIPPIDWDFINEAPKKTIDEHLENIGETVSKSWGVNRPLFVDLCFIDPNDRMATGKHPLSFILEELRLNRVSAIPVTGSERDASYQNEVAAANQQDKLGVCIRLTEEDFDNPKTSIDSLLSLLKISPEEVDLLLDYKYVNPSDRTRTTLFLTGLINSIPYIKEWRNVILSGTAIPKDLSEIGASTVENIERSEWIIWKRLVQSGRLERIPTFGDYGIANPEPFEADPRFIRMSANIRYTANDKFIIFKGRDLRKYGYDQYYQLAAQNVAHPEYKGPDFSEGDYYIREVANRATTPGSPSTWRRAGTNHHLTLIVNDLSTGI